MSDTAKKTAVRVECPPYQLLCRLTGKARATRDAVRDEIREDVDAVRQRDPAARSDAEILLLYSGVHAILAYRVAHKLYLSGHPLSARTVSQLARFMTGIEIHPGAQIGKGLFIDHGHGVVIGETTIIGDNVTIYQGVTLGGTGKEHGKRHPTIGDNVMISTGAKILGSFTIGAGSKIGAGSVVLEEVPPNSTVVGIPGRVVKCDDIRLPNKDLDQIHLPDPVRAELDDIQKQLSKLKEKQEQYDGK